MKELIIIIEYAKDMFPLYFSKEQLVEEKDLELEIVEKEMKKMISKNILIINEDEKDKYKLNSYFLTISTKKIVNTISKTK